MLRLLLLAMAFATVVNRSAGSTASGTSHAVGLPDGCNVTGRLLVFVPCIRGGASGTISNPSGFTTGWADEIGPGAGTLTPIFGCRYRILDGTEGYPGTGATQTVTTSDTNTLNYRGWLFEAGTFDPTTPLQALTAEGASVSPDPPSLSPTGGAADHTWIACYGLGDNAEVGVVYPTSYATGQVTQFTSSSQIAAAERQLNTATENPGTFTNSGSLNWLAATIAIRPAVAPTAALTGTVTSSINEANIRTGGQTIVLTLTGSTWVPS